MNAYDNYPLKLDLHFKDQFYTGVDDALKQTDALRDKLETVST